MTPLLLQAKHFQKDVAADHNLALQSEAEEVRRLDRLTGAEVVWSEQQ